MVRFFQELRRVLEMEPLEEVWKLEGEAVRDEDGVEKEGSGSGSGEEEEEEEGG